MNAGFVKLRRGIVDHLREGKLNSTEFAVFQLLVLMADSSTGSHTINAAVLRSCYFPEMTRDAAQRVLVSLEKKRFIFRLHPASSKHAYKYWVNKYEATTGPNRLRRTIFRKSTILGTLRTCSGSTLRRRYRPRPRPTYQPRYRTVIKKKKKRRTLNSSRRRT